MKKDSFVLLPVILWVVGVAGCRSKPDMAAMAAGICSCMQPMAESFDALEKLTADTLAPPATLEATLVDLERRAEEAEACMDALESRYGDALAEQELEIRTEMSRRCPEVARVMESTDAAFE